MARKQGPFDDPFYRRDPASITREQSARNIYADDALPLDAGLDEDEAEEDDQQFRRGAQRVKVRRGALPRKTASRVRLALVILLVAGVLGSGCYACYRYATHSPRFRVADESNIEVAGDAPNSRAQVAARMNEMVGHNVFQISLEERKRELEKIPWVESASVMRLWPNRLRVVVRERAPVAFVAMGERIDLIDGDGVLMDMPAQSDYSFPVILGIGDNEPLSMRAAQVRIFLRLVHELDGGAGKAGGAQYSRDLDEVDLSDAEDVKVLARGGTAPILLHLGKSDFLPRFMLFLTNVQKWEQERGKLESVDLRFGREVILNPDMRAAAPPATPAADSSAPAAAAPQPDKAKPVRRAEKKHK
jgi:cell division protein FtsQ